MFFSVLWVLVSSLPASAELIDRIVASVNTDVITLSELNQAEGFNQAMGGAGGSDLRRETLEGLINRRLLLQEARRLRFVDITEQDIDAETAKLRERLGSDKALSGLLAKLDLSPEQLRRMLSERLMVERFIEKKIGLFVRVSRDEAEDFYRKNADRFKGKRFPEVQKFITAGLQEQKVDRQLGKYLADLRSKADIRMAPE